MSEPLFGPGDFAISGVSEAAANEFNVNLRPAIIAYANAKLSSRSIDAETPEKVKQIDALIEERNSTAASFLSAREEIEHLNVQMDIILSQKQDLLDRLTDSDLISKELADRLAELERTIREKESLLQFSLRENQDYEEMIAEAPVAVADIKDDPVGNVPGTWHLVRPQEFPWATHRARLVQIEELPKGEAM